MTRIFWKNGRLAWPPIMAAAISVLALLVADYTWRVSGLSGSVVFGVCALIVVLTIAIVIIRSRAP